MLVVHKGFRVEREMAAIGWIFANIRKRHLQREISVYKSRAVFEKGVTTRESCQYEEELSVTEKVSALDRGVFLMRSVLWKCVNINGVCRRETSAV